jgi:hypothetical protein
MLQPLERCPKVIQIQGPFLVETNAKHLPIDPIWEWGSERQK